MKMDKTARKTFCLVATFLGYFFSSNCLHAEFINISYPGIPQGSYTCAFGINDAGQVVGEYANPAGHFGFSWDGSNYSTLNVPGNYTVAHGINNNNHIVGSNNLVYGRLDAFVIDNTGYIPFGYPGTPMGINDAGNIVGGYVDGGTYHGFLSDTKGYHSFDYPGSIATVAYSINNRGQIVGACNFSDGSGGGFFFDGKNFSLIGLPNIPYVTSASLNPYGINDSGVIVGTYSGYYGGGWFQSGFIIDKGKFSLFEYPGADRTSLFGINNKDQVVGWFDDNGKSGYNAIGFMADLSDGIIPFPGPPPSGVPIPGAILLLGAGLGRLVLYSRKKLTAKN